MEKSDIITIKLNGKNYMEQSFFLNILSKDKDLQGISWNNFETHSR